jgi:hypothetical protein
MDGTAGAEVFEGLLPSETKISLSDKITVFKLKSMPFIWQLCFLRCCRKLGSVDDKCPNNNFVEQ